MILMVPRDSSHVVRSVPTILSLTAPAAAAPSRLGPDPVGLAGQAPIWKTVVSGPDLVVV